MMEDKRGRVAHALDLVGANEAVAELTLSRTIHTWQLAAATAAAAVRIAAAVAIATAVATGSYTSPVILSASKRCER